MLDNYPPGLKPSLQLRTISPIPAVRPRLRRRGVGPLGLAVPMETVVERAVEAVAEGGEGLCWAVRIVLAVSRMAAAWNGPGKCLLAYSVITSFPRIV